MLFVKYELERGAYPPKYAHNADAGMDLRTPVDFVVPGNWYAIIDTGVHLAIPDNFCGLIVAKSGLNVNRHLESTGLIDSGYTGTVYIKLYNNGDEDQEFKAGDKIGQIVILPTPTVVLVEDTVKGMKTERGDDKFGSTGR